MKNQDLLSMVCDNADFIPGFNELSDEEQDTVIDNVYHDETLNQTISACVDDLLKKHMPKKKTIADKIELLLQALNLPEVTINAEIYMHLSHLTKKQVINYLEQLNICEYSEKKSDSGVVTWLTASFPTSQGSLNITVFHG